MAAVKTYPISEIFRSIQGEGYHAGRSAVFIRFSGCNLTCSFCFGIKPGRRKPHIILPNKSSISIDKIKIGTKVLTYNNDLELVETTVKNVMHRKVTEWFEIKIEGTKYFITPEHPIFTNRGLIEARNLNIGDIILHSSPSDKCKYRAKHYNSMSDPKVAAKKVKNTDWISIGRKISKCIKDKQEAGILPKRKPLTKNQRQTISKRMLGSNNPNWNENYPYRNWNVLKKKIEKKELITCDICKKKGKLEVHHVDENQLNDSFDNMLCICHACHSKIHKRGYNFWQGQQSSGKRIQGLVRANGFEVQEIKHIDITRHPHFGRTYGPKHLNVYNISCAPYDTYFIDYMWVHNCDTDHSLKREVSLIQLYSEIYNLAKPNDLIVLTGGEPTLQNLGSLILMLGPDRVAIETNGTKENSLLLLKKDIPNVWITVSPKANAIVPNSLDIADEIKVVLDNLIDMEEIEQIIQYPKNTSKAFQNGRLYIQPCSEDYQPAVDYVLAHPWWRLSVQTQKVLGVR